MNCSQALELLDCARPDGSDLDQPELVEARGHLAGCADCQAEFARRGSFDMQLITLAASVELEVPAGLHERLLGRLATRGPDTSRRRWVRRGWFAGFSTAAAAALVLLTMQYFEPAYDPLTVQELRDWPEEIFSSADDPEAMAEAMAMLPEYLEAAGGEMPIPTGWDPRWIAGKPRRLGDRPNVAVMIFHIPVSQQEEISGLLLMVPAGEVVAGDRNRLRQDMIAAVPYYSANRKFATSTWTDARTGKVFVCLVAPGKQDRLREALKPRPV